MGRAQKQIKQQTEEWLDERQLIANMKNSRPQDVSYYMGGLKALEFAGYNWERDSNGKYTLYKQKGGNNRYCTTQKKRQVRKNETFQIFQRIV